MKKLAGLAVAASMPLAAHAAARTVSQSGDWGVYSFMRNGSRVCYALSVPNESAPANVDHGKKLLPDRAGGEGGRQRTRSDPRIRIENWLDGAGLSREQDVQDVRQGKHRVGFPTPPSNRKSSMHFGPAAE
ncbi:hypothetical protein [Rhizobium ruizarguesonis]|uniref:hypothetical protein n=1 Tax=Rhizobium ruizarguesonis TaxID=2081791 RepID=UPI001FEDFD6C|nr:hypothetical protein [Rhizobium ruizarguesonis]